MKPKSILLILVLFISSLTFIAHNPFVNAFPAGINCTSGNAVDSGTGNEHIITFTAANNESDANCTFTIPNSVYAIDYLVVAGGGGGNSGGGGAGGLVTSWEVKNQAGTAVVAQRGSPLTVYPGNQISVAVGTGGTGGSGGNYGGFGITANQMPIGSSGHDSRFGSVVAAGGGRGGFGFGCSGDQDTCDQSGASGGSGGGGAYDFKRTNSSASSQSTVVGAATFGNGGGAASGAGGYRAGSGGGGAGAVGADAPQLLHIAGAGGAGVQVNISGASLVYACGGGGGINENDPFGGFYFDVNGTRHTYDIYDNYQSVSDIHGLSYLIYDETNFTEYWTDSSFENQITYDSVLQFWIDSEGNQVIPDETGYFPGVTGLWARNSFDQWFDWNGVSYSGTSETVIQIDSGTAQNFSAYLASNNVSSFNQIPQRMIYSGRSGGGAGGCADAGRGSDLLVDLRLGASTASNATSGQNNFGHGGGGTDPESTVAGRGGNGVVIIRYITEDPNCPNNGQSSPALSSYPIACIAKLRITAGVTSDESRSARSVAVLGSPISFSQSGDTVSLRSGVNGLVVSIWNNRVLATVSDSASSLIGGTYPVMYRITSGADISESFVLITVRDPAQHTQTRVPVDPRDSSVVLPKLVLGQVSAVQVCVTPRPSSDYPTLPNVELIQNPGNATFDSPNGNNLRMVGNTASILANIEFIRLASQQQRLIQNGKSIELDINVSNTAVGGNGSCEFGTDSSMTIYPLKFTQVRSFSLLPKNGRENN